MKLPSARGPVSETILSALRRPPHALTVAVPSGGSLYDDDLQLSLFLCYQLHYRGFDGVDDGWEWQPDLLRVRADLESGFERELKALCPIPTGVSATELADALNEVIAQDGSPSMAAHVHRSATVGQLRELVKVRSIYQLAEADPHTFGIPRLEGRAKTALAEIQSDEYGGGRPERMHSALFAQTMRALDLDVDYGTYLDEVPAIVLAAHNTMSMFGLHRRLRGALIGHLAALEMTSSLPNRRYGQGLRRLGFDAAATAYFDEHVEADAVHEQIAVHDLCVPFVADHPGQAGNVLFGAATCLAMDGQVTATLLERWKRGASALYGGPAPAAFALRA